MRDIHKQRIIQTAIREYKESVLFGFSPSADLTMCWYFCIRK